MKKNDTKSEAIERIATKVKCIEEADVKQGAITMLSAYISGMMEERAKWEQKLKTT